MTGVIIGKFLPLHDGHIFLIRSAFDKCDEVTVCVFGSKWENIPAEQRAEAVRRCVPRNTSERERLSVAWRDDCACDPYDEPTWNYWVSLTKELAPHADTLFTSEDYGNEFARRLGMRHIMVDRERKARPISGTICREQPMLHWEEIAPPLRGYFAKKVVLVGAESTGKTTLTERLAEHFHTAFVPETGRTWLECKGVGTGKQVCEPIDILHIALAHQVAEREWAERCNGILFMDTDLMVTAAFGAYYFGDDFPEVQEVVRMADAQARNYAFHLLCSADVPWDDDGTRDCTQADREWFNARYEAEMRWRKQPYVKLPADPEDAFREAVRAVESLIDCNASPANGTARSRIEPESRSDTIE